MSKLSHQLILALPRWVQEHLLPVLLTIRAAGFVLATLALWGFATLAYGILDKESFTFDKQLLLALRQLHTPLLDIVMLGFTYIGEPITLLALCGGLSIWLLKLGERSQATILVIAGTGAVVLNNLLKILFGRARPLLWERVVDVGRYSFPSGHAMISFVVLGMIGYLLTAKFPQWRRRISSLTLILVLGIGLSRLYLGVHWPTDILAGYAAGLVWLFACIFSLQVWQERRLATPQAEQSLMTPDS